jgi:hypothetical protein
MCHSRVRAGGTLNIMRLSPSSGDQKEYDQVSEKSAGQTHDLSPMPPEQRAVDKEPAEAEEQNQRSEPCECRAD